MAPDRRDSDVRRPKLLVIAACPFPANRGTPSRILRMAEALLDYYEIDLLTYPNREEIAVPRQLTVHRVGDVLGYDDLSPGPDLTKPALDLKLVAKAQQLLRHHDYHLIYAHHVEGEFVGALGRALALEEVPLVYDVHASLTRELQQFDFCYNAVTAPLWGTLERRLTAAADKFVCVSEDLASDIRTYENVDEQDVAVVPTGIRYDSFRSMIRSGSPFEHDGPKVTYTGTVAPYQNLTALPGIIERVRAQAENVQFFVVTGQASPEGVERIETAAREAGVREQLHIETGVPFAEIPTYLRHSDVLINLRKECSGVPQKLINYMAVGKPVVSAAGSAKPLVDGENAVVVPVEDEAAFADAIIELLDSPEVASALGRRAAADARQYDWDRLATKLHAHLS